MYFHSINSIKHLFQAKQRASHPSNLWIVPVAASQEFKAITRRHAETPKHEHNLVFGLKNS
jgi:hypothetical protein